MPAKGVILPKNPLRILVCSLENYSLYAHGKSFLETLGLQNVSVGKLPAMGPGMGCTLHGLCVPPTHQGLLLFNPRQS